MAKHDVYMPLMIGDWLKGTRGMKAEVRGVYLNLLLFQWDNGYLPSDMEELALIEPEVGKVWVSLKIKFKEIAPGKLQNVKMEEVRSFFLKQSVNGKKGGRPSKPKRNPNHNPNNNLHNDIDIEHESEFNSEDRGVQGGEKNPNVLKVIANEVMVYPTFNDFWELYGKDVGRESCQLLWMNLFQGEKEIIMAHLREYVQANEQFYRKNPEKYLIEKTYRDEIIRKPSQNGNGNKPNSTDWAEVARSGEEFLRKQGLA